MPTERAPPVPRPAVAGLPDPDPIGATPAGGRQPLAAAARGPAGTGASPGRMLLRRFLRHRLGVVSAAVLALLALACLAAPLVAALLGHDPNLVDL
ncbi:MAG: hypothetical protein ACREJ0_08415, partial [Geminicoccaceae bacterium]